MDAPVETAPTTLTATSAPRTGDLVLLGSVVVLLALHFAPTLTWLYERWTMSVWQHAHGLLILPVVIWYVWQELREFSGVPTDTTAWGFVLLVPALLLHAVDAGLHTMLLSAAALVVALPGLSLLFLGIERTRAILFPLLFTAFMLPIPLRFTESIHLVLRHIAARGSEFLLPLVGIPTYLDGLTLQLPRGSLLIADSCSGFSTVYASLAVACLAAHATHHRLRRTIVLLSAVPLAIGANLVRVVLLGILVQWRGVDILHTWMHPASGVLTFVLALPLILWIGRDPAAAHGRS
jgi:exosortase